MAKRDYILHNFWWKITSLMLAIIVWIVVHDSGAAGDIIPADPKQIAQTQLETHQRRLKEYEELHRAGAGQMTDGMRLSLESGMGHEREFVRFWREVLGNP